MTTPTLAVDSFVDKALATFAITLWDRHEKRPGYFPPGRLHWNNRRQKRPQRLSP